MAEMLVSPDDASTTPMNDAALALNDSYDYYYDY